MSSPLYRTHGETPPMLDMTCSSSAYGSMIPVGYGTIPIGGQIIWATPIVANEYEDDGVINYTYSVSFAAAAGEGPGTILKCWAGSKVLFDQTGLYVPYEGEWVSTRIYTVGQIVHYNSNYYELYKPYYGLPSPNPTADTYWFQYTGVIGASGTAVYPPPVCYPGTDTQPVDPTIEATLGVGLTSAYRGLVYAVWSNLLLTDWDNKLPNIRLLVQFGSPGASPPVYTDSVPDIVTDICQRCGIAAEYVDTSNISNTATTIAVDPTLQPPVGIVTGSTMTFWGGNPSLAGSGIGS